MSKLLNENTIASFMKHAGLEEHSKKFLNENRDNEANPKDPRKDRNAGLRKPPRPTNGADDDSLEEGEEVQEEGDENLDESDEALFEELSQLLEADGFEEEEEVSLGGEEAADLGDEEYSDDEMSSEEGELGLEDDLEGEEGGMDDMAPGDMSKVEAALKVALEAFAESLSSELGIKIDVKEGPGGEELGMEDELGAEEGELGLGDELGGEELGGEELGGELPPEGGEELGGELPPEEEEEEMVAEAIRAITAEVTKKVRAKVLSEKKDKIVSRVAARVAKRLKAKKKR